MIAIGFFMATKFRNRATYRRNPVNINDYEDKTVIIRDP